MQITISPKTFARLENLASGFTTPEEVISGLLDYYANSGPPKGDIVSSDKAVRHNLPNRLPVIFYPGGSESSESEEQFKDKFLDTQKAFIKKHHAAGYTSIVEWNLSRFSESSSAKGNLMTGRLRGWKKEGILKAEVSTDRSDLEDNG